MSIDKIIELTPWGLTILAGATSIYNIYASKDGRKADTASTLTGAALNLVNELQDEIERLRFKIDGLQSHNEVQDRTNGQAELRYNILLTDFRELETDIHTLTRDLNNVVIERDRLVLEVHALTTEIQILTKSNLDFQETVLQLQLQIQGLGNNKSVL